MLKKYWLFFAAFALMAVYLKLCGPMTNVSGDAASIWETIKSFHSGEIVPSYVMYKGFASVYPYVWLYDLSVFFGVGEFFFVKLYHCALFAYISAVGFPYLMQKLLKIDHKTWRKALLVVVLFLFWRYTRVFNQLMVDLPSLAYFLMLLNSALKLNVQKTLRCVGRYLYTGLLVGLNMCISGQYSAAAWCVVLYVLIKTVPWRFLKDGAKRAGALLCAAVLIVSFAAVRFCNIKFEENVIDPLRAEGAWIPTGETWLQISFMRRLGVARNGNGVEIPDNRGLAIAKDLFGDEYEEKYEQMVKGEIQLTIGDYFKLAAKYPMDFITRYVNRLFLIISPDDGGLHIIPLFFALSLIHICCTGTSLWTALFPLGFFLHS